MNLSKFFVRTNIKDQCWVWVGAKCGQYGNFYDSKTYKNGCGGAHRIIYEEFFGKIEKGKQIDHLCNNPICVNPFHMKVSTPRENTLRSSGPIAINSKKIHCIKGHPLTGKNLGYRKYSDSKWRVCKACHRISNTAYGRRTRAKTSYSE